MTKKLKPPPIPVVDLPWEVTELRVTPMEIHSLGDGEPLSAWRDWFATNAPEWGTIDDVRGELGRVTDD